MTARRHGGSGEAGVDVDVRVGRDLAWTGLVVASAPLERPADGLERIVIPLEGAAAVTVDGVRYDLQGRASVFDGATDTLFVPAGTGCRVETGGRVAIASAPGGAGDVQLLRAQDAPPAEQRGAGLAARTVRNIGMPGGLEASRLLVCEVVTPPGHWSSYPAHKHDQARPGVESDLEEIYFFDARTVGPAVGLDPFALFSCDATTLQVGPGETVLVPSGFHGPVAAPPDVEVYYLNVMAGPVREWLITDDPRQTAVRAAWTAPDERTR